MKKCGTCKTLKQPNAFYRRALAPDGLQSVCKECNRARYDANREAMLAYSSKWSKEHRESKRASRNAFYGRNRKSEIEKVREWQTKNIAKRRANNARYLHKNASSIAARKRTAKLNAMPGWAQPFVINEIYALAKLRSRLSGIPHHVDHIVPLKSASVCGLHVEHNLAVIPHAANILKSNRYWPEMP